MRKSTLVRKSGCHHFRTNVLILESVCRRQALISWVTRRTRRRDRIETKAISMKATRYASVRSKMVCVLQTYMGKEFNVNGQTV
jgi:hypothetical protein